MDGKVSGVKGGRRGKESWKVADENDRRRTTAWDERQDEGSKTQLETED